VTASGTLGRYLSLVRRASGFRSLFVATLASSLGSLLAVIALVVEVERETGSGTWVGALLIAEFLPTIAIGLLLGPLLDRLSRRMLMIAADLVRLVVFCALPFAGSASAIVALAAVAGIANGFFRPAVYAGLPNLVADEDLPSANAVLQGVENVMWAAGPVIGGALVAASGPDLAYWINAATFAVSAVFVARIPARSLQQSEGLTNGHWRDLAEGFRLVVRSRALVAVLVAWSLVMVGNAAMNVSEVFLALDVLDAGAFGYGVLFGSIGLGLVVGSLAVGAVVERWPVWTLYAGGIALMAGGAVGAALAPTIWVASAFGIVIGVGNGAAIVCNALLVQRTTADHVRGRVFTILMSTTFGVLGAAMAVAGPLTDAVGPRWMWAGAGVVFALAAAAAAVLARDVRSSAGGIGDEGAGRGQAWVPLPAAAAPGDGAPVEPQALRDGDRT
jgi:MFS family permease